MSYELIRPDYPVSFISTVGTSVLTQYSKHVSSDLIEGFNEFFTQLKNEANTGDYGTWKERIALHTTWTSCAELNSIKSFSEYYAIKDYDARLIPSDTQASRFCEDIVHRFLDQHSILTEQTVSMNLRYDESDQFSRLGFPSLISNVNTMINKARTCGALPVLNATPGFKAETSILTIMGAITDTPVFYIHESMQRPFLLPAMPLTVKGDFWARWRTLCMAVRDKNDSETGVMRPSEFLEYFKIRNSEDGAVLFEEYANGVTLSTLGHIFCEVNEGPLKSKKCPPSTVPEGNRIKLPRDSHHYPRGTRKFAAALAKLPFVEKISTKELTSSSTSRVLDKVNPKRIDQIFVQWSDGESGVVFIINTTAGDETELSAAKSDIRPLLRETSRQSKTGNIPGFQNILTSNNTNMFERLAEYEQQYEESIQTISRLQNELESLSSTAAPEGHSGSQEKQDEDKDRHNLWSLIKSFFRSKQ